MKHKYHRMKWDLTTQEVWLEATNDMIKHDIVWHESHPEMDSIAFELLCLELAEVYQVGMGKDVVYPIDTKRTLH